MNIITNYDISNINYLKISTINIYRMITILVLILSGVTFILTGYLAKNIKIAIKYNLDGAYIPSFNNDFRHLNYKTKSGFLIIGSAHNLKEIRIKETQKVSKIFISSIFKKEKNYLGLYKFKNLSKNTKKKIIALGGVSKKNLKKINLLNTDGFAGIGIFNR